MHEVHLSTASVSQSTVTLFLFILRFFQAAPITSWKTQTMAHLKPWHATICLLLHSAVVTGQSSIASATCSHSLTASYPAPSVAPGYVARLVANNLTDPRGIKFDSMGKLLVVEAGSGITALSLTDAGEDCISVSSRHTVVNDTSVNTLPC